MWLLPLTIVFQGYYEQCTLMYMSKLNPDSSFASGHVRLFKSLQSRSSGMPFSLVVYLLVFIGTWPAVRVYVCSYHEMPCEATIVEFNNYVCRYY